MTTIAPPSIPELDALGTLPELHRRIYAGIDWLRSHNHDAAVFATGEARLNIVADKYLSALEAFRVRNPIAEIERQIADIESRLDVGWERTGDAATDRFVQLLTVHEILVNAACASTYLKRLDERIASCRR